MDTIQRLNDWFENKDYSTGVEIYKEFGFSQVLKNIFYKGPSKYATAKLEGELAKILVRQSRKKQPKGPIIKVKKFQKEITNSVNALSQHEIIISQHKKPIRYTTPDVNDVDFDSLPEQLKYEVPIRVKLYHEANAHHYRLASLTDPVLIKQSCQLIIDNFKRIDKFWSRIDYFLDHGIVLPLDTDKPEIKEITDPFEILKRRNNLRTNITKARNRRLILKDTVKIANLNKKIAHWEIEKDDLDKKIKGYD